MKKLTLLLTSLFFYLLSFSAPVITATANGYWGNTATWDLNRLPRTGDTILIPSNKLVTVNDDENVSGAAYLRVSGILKFQNNNSTLNMGNMSTVFVMNNGRIEGGGSASQKIRIGNNSIFSGNQPDITGPRLANYTTLAGFIVVSAAPLPIKFVGFSAVRQGTGVLLQWSTSEEISAYLFELQRSTDGKNWNTAATIMATGNSGTLNNYSYTDKNISAPVLYYRIREVEEDGSSTFTPVRSLGAASAGDVKIAAIGDKVVLQFSKETKDITVRLVSISGQVVKEQKLSAALGQVVIGTSQKGAYVLSVTNGKDLSIARQVVL
jgi:hypothetical protein